MPHERPGAGEEHLYGTARKEPPPTCGGAEVGDDRGRDAAGDATKGGLLYRGTEQGGDAGREAPVHRGARKGMVLEEREGVSIL